MSEKRDVSEVEEGEPGPGASAKGSELPSGAEMAGEGEPGSGELPSGAEMADEGETGDVPEAALTSSSDPGAGDPTEGTTRDEGLSEEGAGTPPSGAASSEDGGAPEGDGDEAPPVADEGVPSSGASVSGGDDLVPAEVESGSSHAGSDRDAESARVASTESGPGETDAAGGDGAEANDGAPAEAVLRIDSISPASGPMRGETDLVVTGTGFAPDCQVELAGKVVATTRRHEGELHVVTEAHEAGYVDLRVINPNGAAQLRVGAFHYDFPPRVERLIPASASASGAAIVFVVGSGLQEGCEVRVGASLPVVRWLASTHLQLELTAHPGGEFDVTVTNPDGGQGRLERGFRFVAQPEIDRIEPARGPRGGRTEIQIHGRHFAPGAEVLLGGDEPVLAARCGPGELRALTPPVPTAGPVHVRVRNPDGGMAELAHGFTYDSGPAPVIAAINPASGPLEGCPVVITGEHFSERCTVSIGARIVQARWRSPSELIAEAPPVVHGGGADVEVINTDGQSHSLARAFTYAAPRPPSLASVHPARGGAKGGLQITVTGSNFVEGCTVVLGGQEAATEFVSGGQLRAVVPNGGELGIVDVEVRNPDGHGATLPRSFTYEASPVPRIADVYPSEGQSTGGTQVTIEGSNLSADCRVLLGGVRAPRVVARGTETLVFVTPGGKAGLVDLLVVAPDGAKAERPKAFRYNPAKPPKIESVSPNRGGVGGGTELEVVGSGFVEGTAVFIDGQPAKVKRRVDAGTLEVLTPQGKAGQMADVVVRNPDGQQAVAKRAFLFDPRYG